MNTPLYDAIKGYKNRISFAMPGHKGRGISGDLINCDVTELRKTADLHAETPAVSEANKCLARLYGAKRSFIMTGGSTTAVHVMVTAALKRGDTLLVSADCHMSVINVCALIGVNIRILRQDTDSRFLIPRRAENVGEYLKKYPDIKAVLLTSPNYYGICADVKAAAYECRKRGIPLLVDEAHGAHFIASKRFPTGASAYADMVCQSAHKTLNAVTGASYLHVCGDLINPARVREIINMYETSSPSYVTAVSADIARAELEDKNNGWDECADMCDAFKKKVERLNIEPLENDDPTRLVLRVLGRGFTGYEVDKILSDDYGIDVEMSDFSNIVLIVTPKNNADDFRALYSALRETVQKGGKDFAPSFGAVCRNISHDGLIKPSDAFYSEGENVPIKSCAGRISRRTVCAYPPGIPVITAGEMITEEQAEYMIRIMSEGAKVTGLSDGNYCVEVVVE